MTAPSRLPRRFARRVFFVFIAAAACSLAAAAARGGEDFGFARADSIPEGCTSIMAGRLATVDGSVITSHTCDGRYRAWVAAAPGATHKPGAMCPLYKGRMKTETPSDRQGVSVVGEIPQVAATFAVLDTAYPCLNEHQVAMGESTFGGRGELQSDQGIFYVEELQRIALERSRTAREAVLLMGSLATEHGYIDAGECLTVADPQEVWHLEILGPGKGKKGAVWAAVRIPDDHVGVAANIARISTLDLDDPDRYLASDNVFSLAQEMGWWDLEKDGPFKFWKAYGGTKPFRYREYYVLKSVAPSLDVDFFTAEELPFSVKPDHPVPVEAVFELLRATYEGSRYSLTAGLLVPVPQKREERRPADSDKPAAEKSPEELAREEREKKVRADIEDERVGFGNEARDLEVSPYVHPWMTGDMQRLFNTLKPGTVTFHRPIAVMFNSYHTVIQCRSWLPDPIGGVCWLGFDNPATSPRVPIFAGVTDLPADFEVDGHKKFRTDSASWAFRRASRLACIRWGKNKEKLHKEILAIEAQALSELPFVEEKALGLYATDPEAAKAYLTRWTGAFCRSTTHRFWELGDEFWLEYLYSL